MEKSEETFSNSGVDFHPLYPSQRFHTACDLSSDSACCSAVSQSAVPACVPMNKKGVCSQPARPVAELSPPAKVQPPPFCRRCRPNDAPMPYVKSHHLLSRLTFHPTAPSNGIDTGVQVSSGVPVYGSGAKKKKGVGEAYFFWLLSTSTKHIPWSLPHLRGSPRVRSLALRSAQLICIRLFPSWTTSDYRVNVGHIFLFLSLSLFFYF